MSRRICVFCGSRFGSDPAFRALAQSVGREIARRGGRIVYGGGSVGLMGELARAAQAEGASVVGYIPERLQRREVAKHDLDALHVTGTMFERKQRMIDDADGFLALPGGLGTLDEILDAVTLRQLGYHDRPIVLLDHAGFWQPWVAFVRHFVAQGFADPSAERLFAVLPDIATALDAVGLPDPHPSLTGC